MKCCVVIPARFASSRLPRKMLLAATGKPLIQHTYEAACRAERPATVVVATDHPAIVSAVQAFGGRVVMTSPGCASGADRVAEVAREMPDYDIVVNVQGDEPEIDPAAIDLAAELLDRDPSAPVATLSAPIRDADRLADPANVKVVCDHAGRALYFSRSPIPFARDTPTPLVHTEPAVYHQHLGLYAYRREFLLRLAELPPSPLEQIEKLEQLRLLQAGEPIAVGSVPYATPGIDTADDYSAFVRRVSRRQAA
ncbi:MAG: 3-deoxy-manno-octulosonate cytidylyltransferase [Planctomycetota bacterium]